jgi:phosphotriesterase-related protein
MLPIDRRTFLFLIISGLVAARRKPLQNIITVNGPIAPQQMGITLVHEHFLVDFIGADKTNPSRWSRNAVAAKVLPYLAEAKKAGVRTIVDCTPAFLGRDVALLQQLSAQSGLQVVTNTGYYGAVGNKYLPPWAFTETAQQLAKRWMDEAENGIEGTAVKPGFIKISVDAAEPLSELHQKLVLAAALTHLGTGLTIFSHTGPASAAFQQIDMLKEAGVHPSAFVWVHAQNEKDLSTYVRAARMGAWVSLDGVGWGTVEQYVEALLLLKKNALLHRVLLSHDGGWYKPDEPNGTFQGYTSVFTGLFPLLQQKGFTANDQRQLLVINPSAVMQIGVRKYKG